MSCVPLDRAGDVADLAANIRDTERSQAARMQLRTCLRSQSRFEEHIAARQSGRDLTFPQHLRSIDGRLKSDPSTYLTPLPEWAGQCEYAPPRPGRQSDRAASSRSSAGITAATSSWLW
jgi:hypothetical protein